MWPVGQIVWVSSKLTSGDLAARPFSRIGQLPSSDLTAKSPNSYIFTGFWWLAVHGLAVPTVFFIGSLASMQFISTIRPLEQQIRVRPRLKSTIWAASKLRNVPAKQIWGAAKPRIHDFP